LLVEHGLPLTDLLVTPELDVCIDGADEIDSSLNAIKGMKNKLENIHVLIF
jgi:ribose 5-phosphate isomerase